MAKNLTFPKGGNTKMFGKTGAGQQAPGTSSKKSGPGPKFAAGGSKNHMFTEREAGPQTPGTSTSGGQDAPETNFAAGGKTKMFGFSGSKPAKAC